MFRIARLALLASLIVVPSLARAFDRWCYPPMVICGPVWHPPVCPPVIVMTYSPCPSVPMKSPAVNPTPPKSMPDKKPDAPPIKPVSGTEPSTKILPGSVTPPAAPEPSKPATEAKPLPRIEIEFPKVLEQKPAASPKPIETIPPVAVPQIPMNAVPQLPSGIPQLPVDATPKSPAPKAPDKLPEIVLPPVGVLPAGRNETTSGYRAETTVTHRLVAVPPSGTATLDIMNLSNRIIDLKLDDRIITLKPRSAITLAAGTTITWTVDGTTRRETLKETPAELYLYR